MTTENNGLDEINPNSEKNRKNPMMELMDSFQSMVDEINGMEVDAIKGAVSSISDAILSPMSDSSGPSAILGNTEMPSVPSSASAESTESTVLEATELLAL